MGTAPHTPTARGATTAYGAAGISGSSPGRRIVSSVVGPGGSGSGGPHTPSFTRGGTASYGGPTVSTRGLPSGGRGGPNPALHAASAAAAGRGAGSPTSWSSTLATPTGGQQHSAAPGFRI